MAKFMVPEKIVLGPGSFNELPEIVSSQAAKRVLIVTGRSWAKQSGTLSRAIDLLTGANIEADCFTEVPEEPSCAIIDRVRDAIRSRNAQLVVGLGGGSAMDAAKAGAILVYSDRPTTWHVRNQKVPDRSLPTVTIPSTAGTGSEATPVAVLTDEEQAVKMSIRGEAMMPHAAIVDPELMVSCPPDLTAIAGMDAFVQAVESYCSKFSHHLSDALTEKASALISKNLVEAYRDGTDLSARWAMAEGSLMAGMALANVRLGVVHGLAHPLGVKYKIPHGLVCAVLIPAVLEFNKPALYAGAEDKYSRLCNILMADPVEFTQNLLTELNLPRDLREYRIKPEDLDPIAEQAMVSGSTRANPRDVTRDDLLELLKKIVS